MLAAKRDADFDDVEKTADDMEKASDAFAKQAEEQKSTRDLLLDVERENEVEMRPLQEGLWNLANQAPESLDGCDASCPKSALCPKGWVQMSNGSCEAIG